MKPRRRIIFMSIITVVLVIILALLLNHLFCEKGDAPSWLVAIDNTVTHIVNAIRETIADFFAYCKYLFLKVTAIKTPEYPIDYLPLYEDARVTEYSYDKATTSLDVSVGTHDSFDAIYQYYDQLFAADLSADYFTQYILDDRYLAYGMIGNLSFLLEVFPSDDDSKYPYTINTKLHYLVGDELSMENFFRQEKGTNSYIFTNPYIYIYQKAGDKTNVYLQLRDYKSQLLSLDTHVELYIDNVFYSSRYYGDTIRLPIEEISKLRDIKMISFDSSNCVRAAVIMEDTLCYDAIGQADFSDLANSYVQVKNLFIYNSTSITAISYLQYLTKIKSLYFQGNNNIDSYTKLFDLSSLSMLSMDNVNNEAIYQLDSFENLAILELKNCQLPIDLGKDFLPLSCKEIQLTNCTKLSFDEYGLFSLHLERLGIEYNYSLNHLGFISIYPNLHILDLSHCDNLPTILNTTNLPNLNMIKIKNCQQFDLSQPLDNNKSLMHIDFANNPTLAQYGDEYIKSISANQSVVYYSIVDCENIANINIYNYVWKVED